MAEPRTTHARVPRASRRATHHTSHISPPTHASHAARAKQTHRPPANCCAFKPLRAARPKEHSSAPLLAVAADTLRALRALRQLPQSTLLVLRYHRTRRQPPTPNQSRAAAPRWASPIARQTGRPAHRHRRFQVAFSFRHDLVRAAYDLHAKNQPAIRHSPAAAAPQSQKKENSGKFGHSREPPARGTPPMSFKLCNSLARQPGHRHTKGNPKLSPRGKVIPKPNLFVTHRHHFIRGEKFLSRKNPTSSQP